MLLHLLRSAYGTLLPSQPRRAMSAIGCRPADICSLRGFRILTLTGQAQLAIVAVQLPLDAHFGGGDFLVYLNPLQAKVGVVLSLGEGMRRRDFIGGLAGSAAVWPLAARAQQIGQVARVVLWLGGLGPSDPETQRVAAAFRESTRGLGWVDGRNLRIDLRWIGAAFSAQEMSAAATETISLSPDVVVTTGAPILVLPGAAERDQDHPACVHVCH